MRRDRSTPATSSSDYNAMLPYWRMVQTILDGAGAMRAAGQEYLPKFPEEDLKDYELRRANAKFTNIYADVVANLAAKPFAEPVNLVGEVAERYVALAEDIDGRGNNLHVFASQTFFHGINNAIDWILVDYPKAQPVGGARPTTVADERKQGLRPYWVHIPAMRMLAVYSDIVKGREIFTHIRFREDIKRRDGFGEVTVERVRIFNRDPIVSPSGQVIDYGPAIYEVWERTGQTRQRSSGWERVESGSVTLGEIALVPFMTGRRKGRSWQFVPPMQDAAYLQIEHYEAENGLKNIKRMAAFPMLAGNGVVPPTDLAGEPVKLPTGPSSVLYAPPFGAESNGHGEWAWIEPSATSLKFLADDIKAIEQQLRELGRQPLTAQTGNLTVVTTAFAAQKGNSAVQTWALLLKDALELAWEYTAKWLSDPDNAPEVEVFTDFALEMGDDKGPTMLMEMRRNGDLSRHTLWEESRRRNILAESFDGQAEEERLIDELPDDDSDEDLEAAA